MTDGVIRRRESNPLERTMRFQGLDGDGAPILGSTFHAVFASRNGAAWERSRATVVERGGGYYDLEIPRDELDFVGSLVIRLHYANGPGQAVHMMTLAITPSDEHDDPTPSVWFTTEPA